MVGTLKAELIEIPKRKKWVRIFALIIFSIGILGLLGWGLFFTLIMWGAAFLLLVWDYQTDKKEKRELKSDYISRFLTAHLRTSPHNPNIVYRVINQNKDTVTVQTIWSGDSQVTDGEIHETSVEKLKPFNEEAFLYLT